MMPSKASPMASVNTKDPATNATPSTIAKALRARRTLRANSVRHVIFSTPSHLRSRTAPGCRVCPTPEGAVGSAAALVLRGHLAEPVVQPVVGDPASEEGLGQLADHRVVGVDD